MSLWHWRWLPLRLSKRRHCHQQFFQNYTDPDDHSRQTTDTPGFKPFTMLQIILFTDFLYQSSFTVNLHHAYRPAFANLSFQLPTLERNVEDFSKNRSKNLIQASLKFLSDSLDKLMKFPQKFWISQPMFKTSMYIWTLNRSFSLSCHFAAIKKKKFETVQENEML